jgi:hypothetical protein
LLLLLLLLLWLRLLLLLLVGAGMQCLLLSAFCAAVTAAPPWNPNLSKI